MARIRLGLCQLNTVVGDLDGNVERILAAYDEAEAAGCDVAVFPELAITGYPPEDLVLKPGLRGRQPGRARQGRRPHRALRGRGRLRRRRPRPLQRGRGVRRPARCVGTYQKRLLPNYAVFDEQRYFAPGTAPLTLFEIAGVRVGVAICEDVWSADGTIAAQSAGGAELIVIPNGSPYFEGRHAERERMVATRAEDAHCHIAYVNQVGGQDELIFDGASFVVDDDGDLRPPDAAAPRRPSTSSTSTSARCSAPGCSTRVAGTPAPALPVVPCPAPVADHPGDPSRPPAVQPAPPAGRRGVRRAGARHPRLRHEERLHRRRVRPVRRHRLVARGR